MTLLSWCHSSRCAVAACVERQSKGLSLWSWVSDEVVPTIYNYQDYENEDLNAWERNYLSEYNRYATFAHTVVSAALSAPLCTALDSIPSVGKQR